jgi:DNA repair exonuclease SbcCD ATPase subunit
LKLITLKLHNFKGIKSFTFDAQGENVSVMGDNATGKTTVFDAFTWLLFDKDSINRKDFEIKTLDKNNQVQHGLDHSVEGAFEVNGKVVVLKKVYSEKWTQKRGFSKKQFTGHTVDHFINSVPATAREYGTYVSEMANENIFRLLTDPKYFNEQMHWQDRRKLLIELCGDTTDEEVIESNDKLSKLKEILGDHKIDDYKKLVAAQKNEINKELEKLPVRIDEVDQGLPDISAIDSKTQLALIKELDLEIDQKEEKRRSIASGGGIAELKAELADLNNSMYELKNRLREEEDAKIEPLRVEKRKLTGEKSRIETEIREIEFKTTAWEVHAKSAQAEITSMRDKWHTEDAKVFEFEDKDICPTCGQSLPADQVKEARDKAMADFNQEKAERLNTISTRGKEAKARLDKYEAEIAEQKSKLEALTTELSHVTAAIEELPTEPQATDISTNPEYQALAEQKKALEAKIADRNEANTDLLTTIENEIAELKGQAREAELELSKIDQHKKGQKRIKELEAREKELAGQYEQLEQELFLMEEFDRSKAALLDEKINSHFKMAKFKLSREQINEGIRECCDTLYDGVPYPNLNNGSKINVGLDIINTLAEHYEFSPPIFIDNKEAVTKLIDVNAQIIALVVSERDKKLRIETAEKQIKEAV